MNTFLKIYRDVDIELLGKQNYNDFLKKMKKRYTSRNTLNTKLHYILAFLNRDVENDKIDRVPFKIKKLPTKKKKSAISVSRKWKKF